MTIIEKIKEILMMKLKDLLSNLSDESSMAQHPSLDLEVEGLCTNSHACSNGQVFIGMPGTRVDGGEFWQSAMSKGAIAAVISSEAAAKYPPTTDDCVVIHPNPIIACAEIACAFYNNPTHTLRAIGVTGTNGKTTTTHLIEFILNKCQLQTAILGTLYLRWPGFEKTALLTTPFASELQEELAMARDAGNKFIAMEVSSHALSQDRVKGCSFEVAVFTNLTQDHLDFYRDMEEYFQAKALLFTPEYLKGRAIINYDDAYGRRLLEGLDKNQVWSYSVGDSSADLWMKDLEYLPNGVKGVLHTPLGEAEFLSPLVGQFNLENLLAAVGVVLDLGVDLTEIVRFLPEFPGVPGRMERVQVSENQDVSVLVDYAHTPDSLENMLKAARPFIQGNIICVFGCGGDRDRTKRPLMGKIVADLADVAVVTSDNPRTEDPERILEDILNGIPDSVNPMVIADRASAIRRAICEAKPGDGILIAGKGHEDYQILGTEKIHFDDREHARDALNVRLGG